MAASPYPVGGARLWWVLQDLEAGSKHLSHALFLALVAGMFMGVLMETAVDPILTLFMGAKSASIVPVTKVYVQIRSLAWPAILLAMVAQAALLATHEVWRPLRTVLWSSLLNLVLTLLLVNHFNQGIAGAAWATLASQYLAAVMHLNSLATQGVFGQLAPHVPTLRDLGTFVSLAGPVCVIIVARVVTYSLMSYTATSYGMEAIAAHQVMIGVFGMLQVFGEPLSQAAQAILPHFLNGPAAEALAAKNSFRRRRKRTSGTVATPQAKGAAMGSVASNRVPAAAAAAATVGSLSRRSESARSVPVEERDPVATQAPDGNGGSFLPEGSTKREDGGQNGATAPHAAPPPLPPQQELCKSYSQALAMVTSLVGLGAVAGITLAVLGGAFPWVAPQVFTKDAAIVLQMRRVALPIALALLPMPMVMAMDGALLASRDHYFLSICTLTNLAMVAAALWAGKRASLGLVGVWWCMALLMSCRLVENLLRLLRSRKELKRNLQERGCEDIRGRQSDYLLSS
eukprot:jgi/Mesvir1/2414/Mv22153-RA.3